MHPDERAVLLEAILNILQTLARIEEALLRQQQISITTNTILSSDQEHHIDFIG